MNKNEIDIEEEAKRVARKSDFNMRKSEYSFDKRLSNLDDEIDNLVNDKIKQFDENDDLTRDYRDIEFKHDTINRYRKKLRKI